MHGAPGTGAIDQAWTDVASRLPDVSRNAVAGSLLRRLLLAVRGFESDGFGPFVAAWDSLDAIAGRPVTLHRDGEAITGTARGISVRGSLLLETPDGLGEYLAGEVTFSPC